MKAPYCPKGSRRCPVSKKCVKKTETQRKKCNKDTRKNTNSKSYKKKKSVKSRSNFYKKYE